MKTVYTILPIYNSLAKRDYQRTGALMPVLCPRHRLPSFQYNAEAIAVGAIIRIDLVNFAGTLTNITTYFPTLSDTVVLATTGTYYKYDGDTLNYLLPYGNYYLKITHANDYIYYSEWFAITNIYDKLVTSWTNSSYETFTSAGSTITSAIETGASGKCNSNTFNTAPGETITVIFFKTYTSGQHSEVYLWNGAGAIDNETSVTGLNVISLTSTVGGTSSISFDNSLAANYSTSECYIIRAYSPDFIRIDFHDTHDLGDICYQSGFTQSLWLEAYLNTPTHEPVLIGEEKNGIFITEKIVTKYTHRIITQVSPVFYRGLIRLPQHDTISIIDEVGFVYAPTVGNLQVKPINWNWFDTGTVEITFNDNSEFVWVSDTNNLS